MSVVDKLKDKSNLIEEMKRLGLKIVDDDEESIPTLELTDEDMDSPAKLAAKVNGVLATVYKNAQSKIKEAREEAGKVAKETAGESELRGIREFLKGHQHTDPVKNRETLELMDFYYAKGGTVEEAYKKACKSLDLTPGVVGEEKSPAELEAEKVKKEKDEKEKKKKEEGAKPGRSDTFSKAVDDEGIDKEKKEPLTIREAAKEALAEVKASMKESGEENPFSTGDE